MRRLLPVLCAFLLLAPPLAAEDDGAAAEVTERGRSLARILDIVLLPEGSPVEEPRTLYLLLDATPSLQTAGFADAFAEALERAGERLGATRIGVLRAGATRQPVLEASADRAATVAAVRNVVESPDTTFQDLYEDVRRSCAELKRYAGRRDLLLVSLENGDGEDDLPGAVKALRQAGVTLHAVARPAFLSDTYWITRASQAPRGVELAGADSAFVELPWGYLFQQGVANEGVSSGFAMYGLSRLAAESGGKVWLHYPPSTLGHRCSPYAGCLFCNGDHIPPDTGYQAHRLRALAPHTGSRREALKAAAHDPCFRALLKAWERLSKEGLVRSRPSVKRAGASLVPQRNQVGRQVLLSSTSYTSLASRAERLLPEVEAIARDLEADLAGVPEDAASPRYRAMAETTVVLVEITRVNLLLFAAFCREVAPELASRRGDDLEPPEIAYYRGDERFTGVGWSSMSLCHGVAPFLEVYLPGGEPLRQELEALDARIAAFLDRHAHTPFAAVVRASGLARFHLTIQGKYVPPPKREIPGSTTDDTTTPSDRPPRGGPTTGGGGGPTSGGD